MAFLREPTLWDGVFFNETPSLTDHTNAHVFVKKHLKLTANKFKDVYL